MKIQDYSAGFAPTAPARTTTVAVVGLGYVGLPLAVAFGAQGPTIGLDIDAERVRRCRDGQDPSGELTPEEMVAATQLRCTDDAAALAEAEIVVVAVPTPVDAARRPDFAPLLAASRAVGAQLRRGAIVIYESTVYPGATEEICVPALEAAGAGRWKRDFFVGYSPERINPGDREHRLATVTKVVAGDTPQTLERVAALYEGVVSAGVHRCSSIAAAEASKVIENTQRDLNVALMNETALILDRLGLDTEEVLRAAGTKWNFLPFRPGLVGGHCIGVDPYYLAHKAQQTGYRPELILSARRINDGMGRFVARRTARELLASGRHIRGAQVNVLGMSFKEDCADLRNTRVVDLVEELQAYGAQVQVHDPLADTQLAQREHGIELQSWESLPQAQALVLAVPHRALRTLAAEDIAAKLEPRGVVIDVKSALDRNALQRAGFSVWRL